MTLVFAYGSNLDITQMLLRCPGARVVDTAGLPDFRLAFGGWSRRWGGPVATVAPAPGRRVPGVLYRLDDADLAALDRYEGHPFVYRRCTTRVVRADGRVRRAHVYVLDEPPQGRPAAPYVAVLRAAYAAWGFDRRTLRAAA